jgi:hypothetical protein
MGPEHPEITAIARSAIVNFLPERGFAAERVPLSGAACGSYLGNVTIPVLNVDRAAEVKCRANGFRELYRWLEGRDFLIVRTDRSEPLVIIPMKLAAEITAVAENSAKSESPLQSRSGQMNGE